MSEVTFASKGGQDGQSPQPEKAKEAAGFQLPAKESAGKTTPVMHPAAPAQSMAPALPSFAQVEMKESQKRSGVRLVLNLALVLVSLGLVGGMFYFGQTLQAKSLSQQEVLAQKQSALTRLGQQIKTEKGKQAARLSGLAGQAQSIHQRSLPWTQIINQVEVVLPKEAQVSSYSGRYIYDDRNQTGRNIISISGTVDTYSRIADLIDALEEAEIFRNVQFDGSSKSVAEDGSETVQLKLSLDLLPADRTTDELVAATSPNVVSFGEEGSDSVSVAPLHLKQPSPPVKLSAKSIPVRPNEGKIQLTWQKAETSEEEKERLAVASYLVQINKMGEIATETKEVFVTNQNYPTYSFTYVTNQPQQEYEFKVQAKDSAGQLSSVGETIKAKAADDSLPAQPQFVVDQTLRSLSPNEAFREEVRLVWQAGDASEGDLYRYHLYVGPDSADLRLLANIDAKTTAYTYLDQVNDKALYFRVVAEDTSGNVSAPQINPLKLSAANSKSQAAPGAASNKSPGAKEKSS